MAPGFLRHTIMSDKMSEQIGVKLPLDEYRQLLGLAAMHSESVSEYVRGLLIEHLKTQRAQFELMSRVFGTQGNESNR
jgi:hypothetical protein